MNRVGKKMVGKREDDVISKKEQKVIDSMENAEDTYIQG